MQQPHADPRSSASSAAGVAERRALIVKFGSIGDVLMAVPGAAALQAQGFAIDWVASQAVAPLLQLYPWIHVFPVDEPKLLRGTLGARLAEIVSLSRRLRARTQERGAYDTVATLYYDRRYSLLTSSLRAPRRIALSRTDRAFALLPGRHHTDEYARILTGRPEGETPFQLAPVRPARLRSPLQAAGQSAETAPPCVVLVPAGARNVLRDDALRRWPIENYVQLTRLCLQAGWQVVLVGGPDDRWASASFDSLTAHAGPGLLQDRIGVLTLLETLHTMDTAAVTVTHDTGPLHMAGITRTAIVSIFGPTDPHGRLPRRANAVAFWGGEGFGCRPCYDGRDYAPCQHNGCMAQISPAMVFAAVARLLAAQREGLALPPEVILPEPAPPVLIPLEPPA